ncbi:hypothetical protein ACJIZ3_021982 [Penstemon smallii]|uniref:Uncharacterized protein n=1 Tax=Penstemon smallii TaxID=265156 RepID=A0ABD3SN80_9LAMI
MQDLSLVLYNDTESADYKSYYLPWYGDSGPFGEPLSFSEDKSYDDTYYLTYNEVDDDYPNQSWYTNRSNDQDYGSGGTWLGDYESYFGGYWGENEVYADKGYEQYDSSIERYGSFYSKNDDMEPDYGENQWPGYDGFGFGFEEQDRDLPDNSSWDDLEETTLYESIFGHWSSPVNG